jgi:hypothetical protein
VPPEKVATVTDAEQTVLIIRLLGGGVVAEMKACSINHDIRDPFALRRLTQRLSDRFPFIWSISAVGHSPVIQRHAKRSTAICTPINPDEDIA